MGRHSAPDETDLDLADTTELSPVAVDLTTPQGRHSQSDEAEQGAEQVAVPVAEQVAEPDKKAVKRAEKQQRKQARGESNTRADLRMLRQNGAVRAQALAAVIAAFLIYTIVMLVIGRTDVYLQWLWVPIVVAGFLVGLVLDLGHRRANRS